MDRPRVGSHQFVDTAAFLHIYFLFLLFPCRPGSVATIAYTLYGHRPYHTTLFLRVCGGYGCGCGWAGRGGVCPGGGCVCWNVAPVQTAAVHLFRRSSPGLCRGHFSMTVPASWMSTGVHDFPRRSVPIQALSTHRGGLSLFRASVQPPWRSVPIQGLRPTTVEVCPHSRPPSNHRGGLSPFKASVQPPWRSVPIQGLRPTTVEVCSHPGPPSNHHLFPVLIH